MCGLTGFLPGNIGNEENLVAMMDAIKHRGSDESGYYYSEDIALGHQRLSIIDLKGGKQPKSNESGVLVFNGEIYNYRELAIELEQDGIKLTDTSDTEVLFQLLNHQPIESVLNKLDGMFAFAYYQTKSRSLYLARDRMGEKPIFYAHYNGALIFGSEISSILSFDPLQNQLSPLNIEQCKLFLSLEYIPGAETGYQRIKSLQPGHYLIYRQKKLSINTYYDAKPIKNAKVSNLSLEQKVEKLDQLMDESVKKRLIADVPIGVFLSGGLDSSLVASYCKKHAPKIEAYTVRMPYNSFDESTYAKQVADQLKIPINIVDLNVSDLHWAMDIIDSKLDMPFADYSLLPSLLLCKATRNNIKVALGGDGADELFAGYPNFYVQKYSSVMEKFPSILGQVIRKLIDLFPSSSTYMNSPFKIQQLSYGFAQPEHLQSFHWMSALSAPEIAKITGQAFYENQLLESALQTMHIEKDSSPSQEKLIEIFLKTYLPSNILTKMDRASMYNSLEVRSPFLAKSLVEFALALPLQDKLKNNNGKYLLKKLAPKYLTDDIIHRKKHGFAMPLAELMRMHLNERFTSVFEDKSNPAYTWIDKQFVTMLWKKHNSRKFNYSKKLWALYRLLVLSKKVTRESQSS